MALPSSGQLSYSQINVELGNSSTSQASMGTMAVAAGKSTSNIDMSDWYGYSFGSISLATYSSSGSGAYSNTITSSGAWTTTVEDLHNILIGYTTSGTGSGSISARILGMQGMMPKSAIITYKLTGTTKIATWRLTIPGTL